MKKTMLFLTIPGAMMFLFTLTLSAGDYVNRNEGLHSNAMDTTEFRNTVMMPTEGINWRSDLELSIKYPEAAIRQGLEGEVIVLCTVDNEGKVSDVKILKDIGGGAGIEVASAVRKMRFNPAVQNGFSVPVTMAIPVVFNLEE